MKYIRAEIVGIGFGIPGFVFTDGNVDSTYGFWNLLQFMTYRLAQLLHIEDTFVVEGRLRRFPD